MPAIFFKQQGSAAITTILAVTLLGAICLTFAGLTLTNMQMATEFQKAAATQYAAEAAANFAIASFDRNPPNWGLVASRNISGANCQVKISPSLTGSNLPTPGLVYQVTVTAKNSKITKIIKFSVTAGDGALKPQVSDWRYN